jgi:hypothetical protein
MTCPKGNSHDSVAMLECGLGVTRSAKFSGGSGNKDIYMNPLEF